MLGKLPSQEEIWRLEAELDLAKKRIAEHEQTIAELQADKNKYAIETIELAVPLRAMRKQNAELVEALDYAEGRLTTVMQERRAEHKAARAG